jgi:hypothetical protein
MSKWMAGLRGGLLVVVSAQLIACATARDVTRGAGLGLMGLGAITVLLAFSPDGCADDDDESLLADDECEVESYDEDSLEARGVLIAGGTAAVLVGGGIAAIANPPPKRTRTPPPVVPPRKLNARPAARGQDAVIRSLIEKRCLPEPTALDLRVPAAKRTGQRLPTCPQP